MCGILFWPLCIDRLAKTHAYVPIKHHPHKQILSTSDFCFFKTVSYRRQFGVELDV